MISSGFTKMMLQNLKKDSRGLPKITDEEQMNCTDWMLGEYSLSCHDDHFTIALPQGMVPYHWESEVGNANMDFPTVKTTLSKVNNHEILLLTDRSFCL